MVRDGVCDCAIITQNMGHGWGPDKALSEVNILASTDDELVLVASPEHPLAVGARNLKTLGKTLLPMHLNSQDFILPEVGAPVREIVDAELRRVAARPQVVMTLKSTQSMLQMVENNIGVTVVSKVAIPEGCCLEVLPVDGLRMLRKLVLIGPRDRTVMPDARRFLEFMQGRI